MTRHYQAGQRSALEKLGFIHLIDTEDLPDFLQETKKKQLYSLYTLNSAGGRPAGGLIQMPESYQQRR